MSTLLFIFSIDGLQQSLAQALIDCLECLILVLQVRQSFILRQGLTVADWRSSLQLHSPSEQLSKSVAIQMGQAKMGRTGEPE